MTPLEIYGLGAVLSMFLVALGLDVNARKGDINPLSLNVVIFTVAGLMSWAFLGLILYAHIKDK